MEVEMQEEEVEMQEEAVERRSRRWRRRNQAATPEHNVLANFYGFPGT